MALILRYSRARYCVKVEDVVVIRESGLTIIELELELEKKFTFAISSLDEFLVCQCMQLSVTATTADRMAQSINNVDKHVHGYLTVFSLVNVLA